jgi:hypothetical protein
VLLQDAAIRHEMIDYGYLLKGVTSTKTLERVASELAEKYRDARDRGLSAGTIAHSYGTLCVGRALEWHPALVLSRVVLWGCILPRDFDWTTLLNRGQVEAVLNETCEQDRWPKVAKFAIRGGCGPSGCHGFDPVRPEIIERQYAATEHSRLGTALHSESVWVPFLLTGEPPP